MNTLGEKFKITSFGESHGKCVGIIIDGCPPGIEIKEEEIQKELDKRKPGQSEITTQRKESDKVEILSGVFKGESTGSPICLLTWNKDADSSYYEKIKDCLRPGHSDYTAFLKYKGFNDYRGGGRFSGRITAGFVMAGSIAKKILEKKEIEVLSHASQVGSVKAKKIDFSEIKKNTYNNILRCADLDSVDKMKKEIEEAKKEKDSIGGVIEGFVLNFPPGIGNPLFDTLEGDISKALFAIPAIKGVEFGAGFSCVSKKGSENNDIFEIEDERIVTKTNNCGGILGGISNGMPIRVRVAVKPTPSISKVQKTVNINKMKEEKLEVKGRHDPCIVPRAVVVVESMLAVVVSDFLLRNS